MMPRNAPRPLREERQVASPAQQYGMVRAADREPVEGDHREAVFARRFDGSADGVVLAQQCEGAVEVFVRTLAADYAVCRSVELRGRLDGVRVTFDYTRLTQFGGWEGWIEIDGVRLLVEAGADVNARQHGGYAPLHSAASRGDVALIDLLLDRGADPNAAADDGKRPIDFARERGHAQAAEHLRARGAAE